MANRWIRLEGIFLNNRGRRMAETDFYDVINFLHEELEEKSPESFTPEKCALLMDLSGESLLYKELLEELKINKSCSICSEDFNDDTKIFSTICLHIFCYSCIEKWICEEHKNTCPMCRSNFF